MKIINILGEEISSILDAWQEAGNHAASINKKNLTSGFYILSINYNGNFTSKKIIHLK